MFLSFPHPSGYTNPKFERKFLRFIQEGLQRLTFPIHAKRLGFASEYISLFWIVVTQYEIVLLADFLQGSDDLLFHSLIFNCCIKIYFFIFIYNLLLFNKIINFNKFTTPTPQIILNYNLIFKNFIL